MSASKRAPVLLANIGRQRVYAHPKEPRPRLKQGPWDKERLYEEHLALKVNNNELRDENMKLKTRINALEKEVMRFGEVLEGQSGDKFAHPNTSHLVSSLKQSVKDLKSELKQRDEEITEFKKNIKTTRTAELEVELQAYIDECTRLRHHLEEVLSRQTELLNLETPFVQGPQGAALSSLQMDNQALTQQLEQALQELERWKERAKDLEKKATKAKKSPDRQLKADFTKLKSDLEKSEKQKAEVTASFEEEKGRFSKEFTTKDEQIRKLQGRLSEAESSSLALQKQYQEQQLELKSLRGQVTEMQREMVALSKRSQGLDMKGSSKPARVFEKIHRYVGQKNILLSVFLSLLDRSNKGTLDARELLAGLKKYGIAARLEQVEEAVMIASGGKPVVTLTQLESQYERYDFEQFESSSEEEEPKPKSEPRPEAKVASKAESRPASRLADQPAKSEVPAIEPKAQKRTEAVKEEEKAVVKRPASPVRPPSPQEPPKSGHVHRAKLSDSHKDRREEEPPLVAKPPAEIPTLNVPHSPDTVSKKPLKEADKLAEEPSKPPIQVPSLPQGVKSEPPKPQPPKTESDPPKPKVQESPPAPVLPAAKPEVQAPAQFPKSEAKEAVVQPPLLKPVTAVPPPVAKSEPKQEPPSTLVPKPEVKPAEKKPEAVKPVHEESKAVPAKPEPPKPVEKPAESPKPHIEEAKEVPPQLPEHSPVRSKPAKRNSDPQLPQPIPEAAWRPVPLSEVADILRHISFRLQIHRITKDKIPMLLFGEHWEEQRDVTLFELQEMLAQQPISINDPSQAELLSRFLLQPTDPGKRRPSTEALSAEEMLSKLSTSLPDWRIFSTEDEELYDEEIADILAETALELQAACEEADPAHNEFLSMKTFRALLKKLGIQFKASHLKYLELLFYSHDFELDRVPYYNFLKAYTEDKEDEEYSQEPFDDEAGYEDDMERAEMVKSYLMEMAHALDRSKKTVRGVFDISEDGRIYPPEFVFGTRSLGMPDLRKEDLVLVLESLQDEDSEELCVNPQYLEEVIHHFGGAYEEVQEESSEYYLFRMEYSEDSPDKKERKSPPVSDESPFLG